MIDGYEFDIQKGESFLTHNSFKLPEHVFRDLANQAGLNTVNAYRNDRFVVHVLRKSDMRS